MEVKLACVSPSLFLGKRPSLSKLFTPDVKKAKLAVHIEEELSLPTNVVTKSKLPIVGSGLEQATSPTSFEDAEKSIYAMIQAARAGDLETIKKYLPEVHIDENIIGCTALHYAVFYNHFHVVKYLVENGATLDVRNQSGFTPLAWGVERNFVDIVIYLLENEADPSIPDFEGMTPLHVAAKNNNFTMVETLLSINTDTEEWTKLNACNKQGFTSCYYAAFNGNLEMLKLLVEYGAKLDLTTSQNDGCNPFFRAITKNCYAVVEYMLKQGVNVDQINSIGRTPLHMAVSFGSLELVQLLISHKPAILLDQFKKSPLDLARMKRLAPICKILEEYNKSFGK